MLTSLVNKVDGRHLYMVTDSVLRADIGVVAWVDCQKISEALVKLKASWPARGKDSAGDRPAEAESSKTSRMSDGSAAKQNVSAPLKRKASEAVSNPRAKRRKGQGFEPKSPLANTQTKGKGSDNATMMKNVIAAAPTTKSDSSRRDFVGVLAKPRPVPEDRSASRNKLRDERFKPYAAYGFGKHGRPYELDIDKIKAVTMPTLKKIEDQMYLVFEKMSDEALRAELTATLHEQCHEASRELTDVCVEVADVIASVIRQELRLLEEKIPTDEDQVRWDHQFFEQFLKDPEDSEQDAAEAEEQGFEPAERSTDGPK